MAVNCQLVGPRLLLAQCKHQGALERAPGAMGRPWHGPRKRRGGHEHSELTFSNVGEALDALSLCFPMRERWRAPDMGKHKLGVSKASKHWKTCVWRSLRRFRWTLVQRNRFFLQSADFFVLLAGGGSQTGLGPGCWGLAGASRGRFLGLVGARFVAVWALHLPSHTSMSLMNCCSLYGFIGNRIEK